MNHFFTSFLIAQDDKSIKSSDRLKISQEKDDKDPEGTLLLLEVSDPKKEDQAKSASFKELLLIGFHYHLLIISGTSAWSRTPKAGTSSR